MDWEYADFGARSHKRYLDGIVHASVTWAMTFEGEEKGYILHLGSLTFKRRFPTQDEAHVFADEYMKKKLTNVTERKEPEVQATQDRRIEIRKQIQESAKGLYESLEFCNALQYIAGELMAQNEEYVLNHQGEEQTVGATNILTNGFTDNQIIFLKDLEKSSRQSSK